MTIDRRAILTGGAALGASALAAPAIAQRPDPLADGHDLAQERAGGRASTPSGWRTGSAP